jgi:hypothetical protein
MVGDIPYEILPDGRRRRFRPKKRTPKWYDGPNGTDSILNKIF